MKVANKMAEEVKREAGPYLTCPRCKAMISYRRRGGHHCFRQHLKEIEVDIARLGRSIRAW
jgi:uncharacterized C2H2 Zn-finger protein